MRSKSLAEILESRIRDAINKCPEYRAEKSEAACCEAVDEALEIIRDGVRSRLQELSQGDDE